MNLYSSRTVNRVLRIEDSVEHTVCSHFPIMSKGVHPGFYNKFMLSVKLAAKKYL